MLLRTVLFFSLTALVFIFIFSFLKSYFLEALFVPTSKKIARKMLQMADLKRGEVLYDLGSGIGTLPILATKEFNSRSIGIEKIFLFYLIGKLRVKLLKLTKNIKIIRGDLFKQNLSKANVITIYLSTKANAMLKEKFEKELAPGSRIVSRSFKIYGLKLEKFDPLNKLYLYKI